MSASSVNAAGFRARTALQEYGLVLVLVVLFAAVAIKEPSFAEPQSLLNLLQQWAPIGLIAVAGTFVVIAGGFDLSVGGVYALCGVVSAGVAQHAPVGVGLLCAVVVGALVGVVNGLVVTKAHVNSFIATLGMGQVTRGIALVLTGASPIVVDRDSFAFLGTAEVGPVAVSSLIFVAIFLIGAITLARTVYGRTVYAIGGNREAARLSGIRVDRRLILAYVLSGMAAALAGAIVASRLGTGQADAGAGIEFDVIIAIVLGGTAISGGFGAMWRTGIGLGLLAVMQNGFDSVAIDSSYQVVIKGGILIIAVSWDEYARRRRAAALVSGAATPSPPPEPPVAAGGAPAAASGA